ncbi:MAG: beta-glucosidase BglX [Gemmatimonadetes bacterium]|nr:MAG: beta-glucosidase BglX [Gemmatimonadota bacterium]
MNRSQHIESKIRELIDHMSIDEKVGQLTLITSAEGQIPDSLREDIIAGRIGGILNETQREVIHELQRIATEESRLGIPLLVGRDVIHGFKTIFPIPLGQAATWNPTLIEQAARISAQEAASTGINWTFAPMMDIARDPRWGRIAESLGEDPYLTGVLAAAMIRGFQGTDLSAPDSIAACAKHFAGYGASESGRDYNTTNIPENELRNVYLPPFKAAVNAGVASVMTSFSDIDGVPATANEKLLRHILRDEWQYDGLVVSDWDAIYQLIEHGLCANSKEAAYEAANAGVDMEMFSQTYREHLPEWVAEGKLSMAQIDALVANVLRMKFRLGLFDQPYTRAEDFPPVANASFRQAAYQTALESIVLLKNENHVLPLSKTELPTLAVMGPLADDGYEQLGTWIFDGDTALSQTPLQALRAAMNGENSLRYARVMETTRQNTREGFAGAIQLAKQSEKILLFLGEESILSGEAHCRADIRLPGNQEELIHELAKLGKPLIVVIMAGRPLALQNVIDKIDALLMAWHPGTMAGTAIADLLLGNAAPSGKLPVTFPRVTGQIPIYYNQKNTGRPATPETYIHIDEIERGAPQVSLGNTSYHFDVHYTPLFPFGFGLSYTQFEYRHLQVNPSEIKLGESITIRANIRNTGEREAAEIVQLYVRDLVGNVTRPVKELKGFQKIRLQPGEQTTVTFNLSTDELAFYNRNMVRVTEPGDFHVWIGSSSATGLRGEFAIIP